MNIEKGMVVCRTYTQAHQDKWIGICLNDRDVAWYERTHCRRFFEFRFIRGNGYFISQRTAEGKVPDELVAKAMEVSLMKRDDISVGTLRQLAVTE